SLSSSCGDHRAIPSFPTRRSSDLGMIARDVGAAVTVCSADVHDRAMARLVAGPLATAAALAVVGAQAEPLLSAAGPGFRDSTRLDRKSTRLNSSHDQISYAVVCLK